MTPAKPPADASAVKRALAALREMEAKLAAMERSRNEPIAIIGVGCRFPGGANGAEGYWRMLEGGVDGIVEIPRSRWNVDDYYSPDPDEHGRMSTRWGGFIDDVEGFDAPFFELSPRIARQTDPQQRLLLELSWEAMENAGLPPEEWAGKQVGVYVGLSTVDFAHLLNPGDIDAYTGIGVAFSIAANRLSYFYDFRGPSITVDTACSSSLAATHMAIQGLRTGETDLAIAGGVNIILSPSVMVYMSRARFMAPDGRCKTFDSGANGFVRGEGCGLVVLRRLSDAIAAGDRILAVIRGSAVNQDGRSAGLTAPNVLAQQAVIRAAVKQAGIRPEQLSLIEAHGTGTSLGDPIEMEALQSVYARAETELPCYVGSVKTNFGHLEAAAGVAGLIKAALSLHARAIPPHLNFKTLNPAITLTGMGMRIPVSRREWTVPKDTPRLAAVSSFGVGGTNAHIVLEEAPEARVEPAPEPPSKEWILALSARTPAALSSLAAAYRERVERANPESLQDICYSAAVRRTHHACRTAVVADSREMLIEGLRELDGSAVPVADGNRRIAFLYSGMGAHVERAGLGLFEREPVFRRSMEACAASLSRIAQRSLLDDLREARPEPRFSQPVHFAVQVSLTELWRSWGIAPAAVLGHSLGEIAAAHATGALTLDDAMAVAFHRSRLMNALHGQGRMAAVALPRARVDELLTRFGGAVTVAAVNSPTSVVVAGATGALANFAEVLKAECGIEARHLQVETPFHSPLVAPFEEELRSALRGMSPGRARVPMMSSVTAQFVDGEDLDGLYWAQNMRQPVLFAPAIENLAGSGYDLFVEVGAHPVLARPVAESIEGAEVVPSLRRGQSERLNLLRSVARLYLLGAKVGWSAVVGQGRFVEFPSYPWQRQRFPLPKRVESPAAHTLDVQPSDPPAQGSPPRRSREWDRADLDDLLRTVLAKALGILPAELDENADLNDAGLDSIALLECLSKLEQRLGSKIPLSALRTTRVTVRALSERLWEHLQGVSVAAESVASTAVVATRIECVTAGSGPAIVLLPPIAAVASIWQRQVDELSRDYRVLIPHYPGYGTSTGSLEAVAVAGLAAEIAAMLDRAGVIGPVHLAGWSIGGMIAQQFAVRFPERVGSLALVATTSRLGIENSFTSAFELLQGLARDWEENFPYQLQPQRAEYDELLRAGTSACSPAVHLRYADLALQYDGRESLAAVRGPVIVVSGARDALTPPSHGAELQSRIAGAAHVEIAGAGHYLPLTAHKAFNVLLRRFWAEATEPTAAAAR